MESAKNKTVSGSTKSLKTPMKRAVMGAPLIAQSAQVVGVHSKPASLTSKKSLASPLRVAAANQAALSPTFIRRTALGQLQPNLMIPPATISITQTSSSSTIVAKQLKRVLNKILSQFFPIIYIYFLLFLFVEINQKHA